MSADPQNIDVICQIKKDATIIPIKLRFADDDGMMQEYKVKGWRYTRNDVPMPKDNLYYDCQIESFGQLVTVQLIYNSHEHVWKLIRK